VRTNIIVLLFTLVLAFGFVIIGCNSDDDNPAVSVNHAPVIESVVANPDTITLFWRSLLSCEATDSDNDTLIYRWSSEFGTLSSINDADSVYWSYITFDSGSHCIYVSVSDDIETVHDSVTVFIDLFTGPRPPRSPNPLDNAEDVPITTDLSWSCFDWEILTFDVYFGTTSILGEDELIATASLIDTFDLDLLENSTTYFWKIMAKNNSGGRTPSPVWSFTTIEN
jgi:hypothetical protein